MAARMASRSSRTIQPANAAMVEVAALSSARTYASACSCCGAGKRRARAAISSTVDGVIVITPVGPAWSETGLRRARVTRPPGLGRRALRPHQLLVRHPVRLVRVRPLPPLQVLDVRLE